MKRREFILGSAAAAGAFAILESPGKLWGQSSEQAKRNRIAIMSRSFNPVLKSAAHADDPKRNLDILDLPAMVAERYGVHYVEFQHTDFASTETGFLEEFKSRVQKAKSQINQINVEFRELNISSPDPVLRLEAIDLTKRWVDHAVTLGCPRIMVNQGTLLPAVRPDAIEALKAMNRYAKAKSVLITMENKNDASPSQTPRASWQVVVEVIEAAGIRSNPDVGNFPDNQARAAGLRALYPLSSGSSHCHYNPAWYSEADAIKISKEVGYKGLYSIEAEAYDGPDPYVGVQTILDELLKDI
jgi:sugar phosphate isomerase/epimerase